MAHLTQVVNAADYVPGSPANHWQGQREGEKGDWMAWELDGPWCKQPAVRTPLSHIWMWTWVYAAREVFLSLRSSGSRWCGKRPCHWRVRLMCQQPGDELFALAHFRTQGLAHLTEAGDAIDNVSSKVELKQDWKTFPLLFNTRSRSQGLMHTWQELYHSLHISFRDFWIWMKG